MRTGNTSGMRWLWLSVLVLGLDQWTKSLAGAQLPYGVAQPFLPGFNFTLVHNTGAAFSLLRDAGGWQRGFFIVLGLVISAVLLAWLWRLPRERRWLPAALALVLGGAAGNLVDRIALGHVVDFVDLYVGSRHWPAFNVADSAISIGVLMLLWDSLRGRP
ncbi:MAG: signal peptidase II [Gammaproteobacteria bacterium]|nr:signal peptidase II [Gammaproteobacteria bacterium]